MLMCETEAELTVAYALGLRMLCQENVSKQESSSLDI